MVAGGPYGIEDILGGAGYRGALLILLILPLVWTLPTTLMIGELSSALPEEGGFYVWVRRALGPFWGYQEAWLSLTASIFDMAIYPTLFTLYLARLSPALCAGWRGLAWELLLITGCCVWNLLGAPSVGRGSQWLFVLLLAPFAVLIGCAVAHGLQHPAPSTVWTAAPRESGGFSVAVLVGLWNYMGWDNASTFAQEVEDPPRTYPRAMLLAGALVAVTYVLPMAAVAFAGMPLEQFTTGAWVVAARSLAGPRGGPVLALAVVAGGMLSALGMFNALTLSYTRLPMVLAEQGLLPRALARRNSKGVPVTATVVCGVGWALALSFSYERLISVDLMLYGSSLVLEFVALLVLRVREPGLERPFRMGPLPVAAALSALPVALVGYALWAARDERLLHMPALLFGGLVALAGAGAYPLARRRWQQPSA
ncbi:APC family permease [Acidipila sp. EB88]|nr:APC family permease [Acidipila sp. EB88]